MLDETSYHFALMAYVGAAVLMLLLLAWWGRRRAPGWTLTAVLLGGALLLTPAFPREGVQTMAPALIVAGFGFFTEGLQAAEHALRPLAATCGLALGTALLLRLTVLRRRRQPG